MITEFDVYAAFRRAQADANGRGYRLPKDWTAFQAKMTKQNAEWLYKAMVYFNTTYNNVNLDQYMACGFELWKGFTYKHFCDSRVIGLYIEKDKIKKRKMESSFDVIDRSFDYIVSYMSDKPKRPGYSQLQNFCKLRDGEVRTIINTYNRNEIDTMTMMYCLVKRFIIMSDDERVLMPYISQRYRELQENLKDVMSYIRQKEIDLNERTGWEETIS